MGIKSWIKKRQQQNQSKNLLPPPVRRLVFGDKNEEEDLKQLVGDLYDQLENLEDAHDQSYAEVQISIEGKKIEVYLKKDRGASRSTRSRKFKEETITFTLSELISQDRKYLLDQAEEKVDGVNAAPSHEVVREEGAEDTVRDPSDVSEEELMELDSEDSGSIDMSSPIESKSDDSSSDSVKESILNHTN